MATTITIDTKELNSGIDRLIKETNKFSMHGLSLIAEEIMRLSTKEVPHDKGQLQNSGQVDPDKDGYTIGYNKIYAARLHEHPEYRFQKGRKGKYLEDPIKKNTKIFLSIYQKELTKLFT